MIGRDGHRHALWGHNACELDDAARKGAVAVIQPTRRTSWYLILCCVLVWAVEAGSHPLLVRATTLTVNTCLNSQANSLDTLVAGAASGDAIIFTAGLNCTGATAIKPAAVLTIGVNLTINGTGAQ